MKISLSIIASITALLTATFLVSSAESADWPFYRGPSLNGVSTETGWQAKWPESGPKVAWKKNVGIGASCFVVVGDKVITTGNRDSKDVVSCLNADDGKEIWKFEFACKLAKRQYEGGTASTPTVDGDVLYNLSYDGQLHCLKLSDGSPVWQKHVVKDFGGEYPYWKYACSPLIEGELLILDIGGKEKSKVSNSTIALNKKTGELVWGSGKDKAGYATPVPFNQGNVRGIMVFKGKALVAVKAEDGTEMWRIPWQAGWDINASTPLVMGDRFFISCGYKTGRAMLFQLTEAAPRPLWAAPNQQIKFRLGSPAVLNGYVYGVSEAGGSLVCVDLKDGKVVWSEAGFGAKRSGDGNLVIAGDKLVVLSPLGELVIAEATNAGFKPISRAKVLEARCWVSPVLANGRIYCRDNLGNVVCIDVRK